MSTQLVREKLPIMIFNCEENRKKAKKYSDENRDVMLQYEGMLRAFRMISDILLEEEIKGNKGFTDKY